MKLKTAVVGATGIAGQQFLTALENHPSFEITCLAASERSAGKSYRQALTQPSGQVAWYMNSPLAERFASMTVARSTELPLAELNLVFSAVESDAARELEAAYAAHVPVISTASAYRYETDVPIIIPAINGDHAGLVAAQRKNRGWKGFVLPIPNCTTTGLVIALAPLARAFGVERVIMTSMQAVSGAGRSPGVIALDIVDNIIPYIPKEEEKVERETQKILGTLAGGSIQSAPFPVSCTCTRVPVLESHFEAVTVALSRPASIDEVKGAMREFGRDVGPKTHPSAPEAWIRVEEDPFRPQPRRDRDNDRGMATTVGRVREDRVLGTNGVKFCLVSHNTKMGAAMGAVLVAEDLRVRGIL